MKRRPAVAVGSTAGPDPQGPAGTAGETARQGSTAGSLGPQLTSAGAGVPRPALAGPTQAEVSVHAY